MAASRVAVTSSRPAAGGAASPAPPPAPRRVSPTTRPPPSLVRPPSLLSPVGAGPLWLAHTGRIGSMTGVVPSGRGHMLTARGNVMAFKAVADQTGGDFSLMERTVPPGARTPPPHRHVNCSEAFFVLAGTITFRLDDDGLTGGAGVFLRGPRGAG